MENEVLTVYLQAVLVTANFRVCTRDLVDLLFHPAKGNNQHSTQSQWQKKSKNKITLVWPKIILLPLETRLKLSEMISLDIKILVLTKISKSGGRGLEALLKGGCSSVLVNSWGAGRFLSLSLVTQSLQWIHTTKSFQWITSECVFNLAAQKSKQCVANKYCSLSRDT